MFKKQLLASMIFASLFSCGGETAQTSTPIDEPSELVLVQAVGEIDGFGSVIVNGVHYETDNADIYIDGESAEESDLDVGHIVEIIGEMDLGGKAIAHEVRMRTRLAGDVNLVDVENRTITVLGKTIQLTDDTKLDEQIDEVTLAQLLENAKVAISGYLDDDGNLIATRINLKSDDFAQRVSGAVSALDEAAQTFEVSGVTVHYAEAQIHGVLADEATVMVIGKANDEALVAQTVRVRGERIRPNTQRATLTGILQARGDQFQLEGMTLVGLEDVRIRFGERDDIAAGKTVTVRGLVTEDGSLDVRTLVFDRPSHVRMVGTIEAVVLEPSMITVNDQQFVVVDNTDFLDSSASRVRQFSLSDLAEGDRIAVIAFQEGEQWIAKRIHRLPPENRDLIGRLGRVKTTVDSISDGRILTEEGVTIDLADNLNLTNIVDLDELTKGSEILVRGVYDDDGNIIASLLGRLGGVGLGDSSEGAKDDPEVDENETEKEEEDASGEADGEDKESR